MERQGYLNTVFSGVLARIIHKLMVLYSETTKRASIVPLIS